MTKDTATTNTVTTPLDRTCRRPLRRALLVAAWLLLAAVTAAVAYTLLVLGGR